MCVNVCLHSYIFDSCTGSCHTYEEGLVPYTFRSLNVCLHSYIFESCMGFDICVIQLYLRRTLKFLLVYFDLPAQLFRIIDAFCECAYAFAFVCVCSGVWVRMFVLSKYHVRTDMCLRVFIKFLSVYRISRCMCKGCVNECILRCIEHVCL